MTQQTTAERMCRLIIDRLKILNGTMGAVMANNAAQQIAAEIDTLTRERDEARAQLDNAAREMGESMIASARLRAEAERLRPAAEAWEATEAWRAVGMHIENRRGRDDAYQAMDRAAARAREAAKEKGA